FRGGFFEGVAPGWHPWALAALAGVINMVGSLSLYYSFQVGVMSVVAPVTSAYPALTVALAISSGERITALRGAGLAVTLAGVILAATSFAPASDRGSTKKEEEHAHLTKGVTFAIVASVAFGVLFWFLGFYVLPLVGPAISVWVIRLTCFTVL